MPSTNRTLWDAVKSEIVDLALTGLTADTIRQQQIPANPKSSELTSGAFLCPVTERKGPNGTNLKSDVGYGYALTLLKVGNRELGPDVISELMEWREAIAEHFDDQTPLRSSGCYKCEIERARAVLPEAWANQYDATALIIRCWVLE